MPRKNNRHGPRAMPLQKIAERVGVPVAQPKIVVVHLPEPDEGVEPKGSEIRMRRRVWDDIRAYSPRGGVAR